MLASRRLLHAKSFYFGRWAIQSELLIEIQNQIFAFDFPLLTEDLPTAPCARRVNDSMDTGPWFNIYTNSTKFTSTCCGER